MIVKLLDSIDAIDTEVDKNLIRDKNYIVLGITFLERRIFNGIESKETYLTILRAIDQYPCMFNIKNFEIIDQKIPEGWVFYQFLNGAYSLKPKEFTGDFWDNFHDSEPEAEKTFELVYKKLMEFHGWH